MINDQILMTNKYALLNIGHWGLVIGHSTISVPSVTLW